MTPEVSSARLLSATKPLAVEHDLALVDLDGVTYRGHLPIEYAAASLAAARAIGLQLRFITNNASRTPSDVAAQLDGLGIPATASEVLTSAQACAALLRTRLAPGTAVLVVGGPGLIHACEEAGFDVRLPADQAASQHRPAAVAMGFAPSISWPDLAEAAYAVAEGAWFVASNLDKSLPTDRGYAPGNGALVGAVQAATGVSPDSSGKPSPKLYQLAVDEAHAKRPLVVGDRLDTDLTGARAGGIPGLLVFTGVSSPRDAVLAPATMRPCYLGADLRALLEPHPQPYVGASGWWHCGEHRARVTEVGTLEQVGAPGSIDQVRVACAAVWSARDAGRLVEETSLPEFTL